VFYRSLRFSNFSDSEEFMIIEIEGIDGVGKTTQCELLKEHLQQQGRNVVIVKDLESTELGRNVRKVLVGNGSRPPATELFSFLACKAQLFSEVVVPIISDGGIVICDRGIGSLMSYFEFFGFSKPFLLHTTELATNGLRPDITILIDVTVEEATRRKEGKAEQSKFDRMDNEFFQRQRASFLELAELPSWVVVDGTLTTEEMHAYISDLVEKALFTQTKPLV